MTELTHRYCFVLGTNPLLSVMEIVSVLPDYAIISYSKEILFIEGQKLDTKIISRLGGTIKIIKIHSEYSAAEFDADILVSELVEVIVSHPSAIQSKVHFGLSIYDNNGDKSLIHRAAQSLRYLYINIKKSCREKNVNLAFINTKERQLASASVIKNKLCGEDGLEISLLIGKENILFGITESVQDIDNYTHYDVDRPVRDLVSGTTPPKLAKIMVNLASQSQDATIIDPFCGSGTYIQEMALLGFKNIYGSDNSPKAVNDSRTNIQWLQEQVELNDINIDIFVEDARSLTNVFNVGTMDAIVGEGYLGPAMTAMLKEDKLLRLIDELDKLYSESLSEFAKILDNHGTIVLALPMFKTLRGNRSLHLNQMIRKAGLKIDNRFDDFSKLYSQFYSERGTAVYSRPDQLVQREIVILKKI